MVQFGTSCSASSLGISSFDENESYPETQSRFRGGGRFPFSFFIGAVIDVTEFGTRSLRISCFISKVGLANIFDGSRW